MPSVQYFYSFSQKRSTDEHATNCKGSILGLEMSVKALYIPQSVVERAVSKSQSSNEHVIGRECFCLALQDILNTAVLHINIRTLRGVAFFCLSNITFANMCKLKISDT